MERNEDVVRQDAQMWALVAEMQALITERKMMVAENASKASQGLAAAYGESAFIAVRDRLYEVAHLLRTQI